MFVIYTYTFIYLLCYVLQGINRTLLSWIKLWDTTVFGHSSVGRGLRRQMEERGRSSRSSSLRGGSKDNRKRVGDGGLKEWKEFRDPAMFSSEEVGLLFVNSKMNIQCAPQNMLHSSYYCLTKYKVMTVSLVKVYMCAL